MTLGVTSFGLLECSYAPCPVKYVIADFSAPRGWAPEHDCLLCLARTERALLCAACASALPELRAACRQCAVPLAFDGTCAACLARPPAFDRAIARFEYAFPVDRLVQRFKYAADVAAGRWLARALGARVRREARPDLLVVPPLAPRRLRERGFNQALEIAKVLGRELGVPCDRAAIARRRETPAQARLGRRERRANLSGAFASARSFERLHVVVVDDVVTTGATADAMARLLKDAGARRVDVWSIARAPQPDAG